MTNKEEKLNISSKQNILGRSTFISPEASKIGWVPIVNFI